MKHLLKINCLQWVAIFIIGLMMVGCGSKKSLTSQSTNLSTLSDKEYMKEVVNHAPDFEEFSAKMKFVAEYGHEKVSVGGNIKMKKDEAIQLSLVAIGFVEAAKIEITPKHLIILDRISRRYIKVPYSDLKFFSESKIDFYTLQSLFWNELFLPGVKHVGYNHLKEFKINKEGEQATLTAQAKKQLTYSFLTALTTGLITESQIKTNTKYQLNWEYTDFLLLNGKQFPSHMTVSVQGSSKALKANLTFTRWSTESNYEPVTIPKRYQEIEAKDILKHLLSI